MSSIGAALNNSANALNVLQRALSVIQNNVSNASTPGYASQTLNITAQPFDLASGAAGGIAAQGLISSRDSYADTEVQRQLSTLGAFTAQAQGTSALQSLFDVTGSSGVTAALNNLYTAFSAWSASPADSTAEQNVISAASGFASAVSQLSQSLQSQAQGLNQQIGSTVDQINTLAGQVQQYNQTRLQNPTPNPGADANLENTLEQLSQLTNFTALSQPDGTVTVLVGGGSPLVIGNQQFKISAQAVVDNNPPAANPQSQPTSQIVDAQGNDITASVTGGQLGGLLDVRNRVLSSIIGDSQQTGSLNQFAQSFADTVNNILTSGTTSTGTGAPAGLPLFTYSNTDATFAAGTLAVNPAITPAQLAPVDSSGNANGNANQLASLATNTTGEINGQSFVSFFGGIAAAAGQENATATSNQTLQQQVVSQTQSQRDQISGVSLDEQAAAVLQFQRAYQAVAQVLTVVNTLADSILAIIPAQ
ncbi:MAG TPA: flagellar hook-associated protein FlgK [Bryobacteraceae bacterium]|nr:flagellar hook-associated protein FlgK [Bryobacteraceae bacterium]